ncbi:hypothetical protein BHF68_02910 [Desulfuribacillus alkaliarsenatis]|uniref:Flagellar Assembly Protein A N-terminal region domain-containing protein n=1 Tax=Desulfuribacillus alkaliarsenatis TaxID=766136 RepID=A0A1E5G6G6_9FIRM|nr:hypothetical protein BHF68_02910 [Desulfuribacillus alkaliarsenatis]
MEEKKPCNWDKCITIKASRDKLEAYLQIDRTCNDDTVDIEILKKALIKARITHGIEEDVLESISENVAAFKGQSCLIAKGFPAENGVDGYIELIRDDLEQQKKAPLVLKDGRVDFYQVKDIPTVMRGEEIARKIPPIEGKPGKDVYGNEIKPKPGKDPRFPVGKNVVVNKEGTSIYALIDGQVAITERGKINVFSLYEVHGDVDFSTGNIDFVGSVLVHGNILTGFSVKANGDVRVKGNIEGANVEAGGSIEIIGGIFGYHKGLVKAKQSLRASFIQNGIVSADNEVLVSDSIMHSKVSAGNNIILDGTKALIVGGVLRAGEEVSAKVIGNSMATPTEIEVGVHPELRTELSEIKDKLKEIATNLEKTEQALELLNKMKAIGKMTEEKEAMREKIEASLKAMKKYKLEGTARIQEIEMKLEDITKARIKVNSVVYPGTKFVVGNQTKFIREETRRSVFYIKDKEITFMPTR